MKLAMNMILWTDDVSGPESQPLLELVADAGFDGVEIPVLRLEPDLYVGVGERIRALGMIPIAMGVAHPAAHPASPDVHTRRAANEHNRLTVECAAASGSSSLIGPLHAAPVVFSGDAPTAHEREWAIEGARALCDLAGRYDMTIALESLNHFEHFLQTTAAETAAFCRDVGDPRCKMLYDTFHAHIEETDLWAAITGAADVLGHVHLSENNRATLGTGQVGWSTTFEALSHIGFDGWFGIEAFGIEHPELARQMRMWRPRFDSAEELVRTSARFAREAWAKASASAA